MKTDFILMKQKSNLKPLDQFVDEQYGKKGTSQRDTFEKGYEAFNSDFLSSKPGLKKV